MGLLEKHITAQTRRYLSTFRSIWFWKVCDKFTPGIPDIIGCHAGILFAIELKRPGKKASKIQAWTLKRIKECGGRTLSTDSFEEVERFIDSFPTHL